MADATLDDIRDAIMARLQTLSGAPFAYVGEWAGEVSAQRVDLAAVGNTPAVQLAFGGEDYEVDVGTMALGQAQWVGTSQWIVYVTATDMRSTPETAADGTSSGLLGCMNTVTAALAGLPIANLYQSQRLGLKQWRPRFVRNGVYVYALQCTAERTIVSTPTATVSQALTEIRGDANMTGTTDPDPNFYVPGKVVF